MLPSAARTADQSVLIVVMSADVMFAEVTACARALYAVVRSVVCCVVGELVYKASNWPSSVASPARVVPEAAAVTRLFSNDWSAERLLGESPSLANVWNAARTAVNSPTVVPEASSIVWTSFRSVCKALVNAEFDASVVALPESSDEQLEPLVPLLELVEDPVELVEDPVVALLDTTVEEVVEWCA